MADENKNQTKTNEKPYDGKIKGDSFDVIHRSQMLAAEIFIASAGASKEYRFTICKVVQTHACEVVHLMRQANSMDLFKLTEIRKQMQDEALERLERIVDLLPVIRKCRCITPGQEKELNTKVQNLKFAFKKWVETDNYRLEESRKSKG